MITFVYDKKLMKVGCVLLQAAYGSTLTSYQCQSFGEDNWLLAPTPDLQMYHVADEAQLKKVIEMTNRHRS